MNVRVSIGGLLTKPEGKSRVELELSDGATILELLRALRYTDEHIPCIMASVGGTVRRHEFRLKDRDEVKLSILVGGG